MLSLLLLLLLFVCLFVCFFFLMIDGKHSRPFDDWRLILDLEYSALTIKSPRLPTSRKKLKKKKRIRGAILFPSPSPCDPLMAAQPFSPLRFGLVYDEKRATVLINQLFQIVRWTVKIYIQARAIYKSCAKKKRKKEKVQEKTSPFPLHLRWPNDELPCYRLNYIYRRAHFVSFIFTIRLQIRLALHCGLAHVFSSASL